MSDNNEVKDVTQDEQIERVESAGSPSSPENPISDTDSSLGTAITPTRRGILKATGAGALSAGLLGTASAQEGSPDVSLATPSLPTEPTSPGDDSIVVEGNARFQVLTPTLVRLEYAGDQNFQDRPTFFAINRAFETPDYTTRVVDGYREIETDQLLLRYEQDSGPFTPENTSIELTVGGETTTATPTWDRQPCIFGERCQAEDANLSGSAQVNSNVDGYEGSGYATIPNSDQGGSMEWTIVDVPSAGEYTLHLRQAHGDSGSVPGDDPPHTLSVYANGEEVRNQRFPNTGGWGIWETMQVTIPLDEGKNSIALRRESDDPGVSGVNIDYCAVTESGASMPEPQTCVFGGRCQAEDANLSGSANVNTNVDGYGGSGYVSIPSGASTVGGVEWNMAEVPSAGDYTLHLRQAHGDSGSVPGEDPPHTLSIYANGEHITDQEFPNTGGWGIWEPLEVTIPLDQGRNTISVRRDSGDPGVGGVNLDFGAVTGTGESMPGPDRPDNIATGTSNIGGWKRDLDRAGGEVPLGKGLLSRDGWYLLEDSTTALPTEDWVEPRPDRDAFYQDGYFFGYGHDYKRGLREFSQLTGPALMLPRWAFGNWYSVFDNSYGAQYYYDVIERANEERMPIDDLVLCGNYRDFHQWNGWAWRYERFPDPNEFYNWAENNGRNITLPTHPSIQEADPNFSTVQEIADSPLPRGFCIDSDDNSCYVWDWARKSHAESYFHLHERIVELVTGNENGGTHMRWWLDWLADGSRASMPGLTADTWINSLYYAQGEARGMRGFAFSRMGSSYQAGDRAFVPGPWAAHRYTVHFTGDTHPSWEMLDFETKFTVSEGNIGVPYVTHDIGSHQGKHPAPDLYTRWVQSGTFQPILRLHSNHGDRLPWQYGQKAEEVALKFLRLRESLIPYLYTLGRQAHDTGLPMTRGMYLDYPDTQEAYEFDHQYMFGDQLLVAPVASPSLQETSDPTPGVCTVGERCQAENAQLNDVNVNSNVGNYTGDAYVSISEEGASIEWTVTDVPSAGEYTLNFRQAHGDSSSIPGDDPPHTFSVYANGEHITDQEFPNTGGWGVWQTLEITVQLEEGENTIAVRRDSGDPGAGGTNIDYLAVTEPGEEVPPRSYGPAEKEVWFPEGKWTDWFTGETYEGPSTQTLEVPLERMPVFGKAGGIVPQQPYMDHVGQEPVDPLILNVYSGADGSFSLYEDAGEGHDYRDGEYAWTEITYDDTVEQSPGYARGGSALTVEGTRGSYPDQPTHRDYEVRFADVDRPSWVRIRGEPVGEVESESGEGWWYDEETRTLTIYVEQAATRGNLTVSHGTN